MSAIDSQKTQTVLSDSEYFCCLLCGSSLLIQPSCGNRINLFGRSSQINVVNEIKQLNISELQNLEQVVSPPFICQNKCYRSLIKLSNLRRKVKRLTEDFAYTFKEAEGKRPIRFKRPGSEDDLVIYPRAVKTSRLSSPACNPASSSKTTPDYKIKAAEDIARSLHLANFVSIAPRILPTTTNGLSTAAVRPPDVNTSHQTLTEREGIKHLEEHGNNTQPFFVTQKDSIQQAVTQTQPSPWISEQGQLSTIQMHSVSGTPGQSHPTVTQVQSESDAQGHSYSTVQRQSVTRTHGQSHPTLTQVQTESDAQGHSYSTVQRQSVTRTHGQSHPTLTQVQSEPGAQGRSYSTVQTQPVTWTHGQSHATPSQAPVQLHGQGQVVYAVSARTEPQAVLDNIGQSQLLKQTELLLSGSLSQVSNISAASSVMAIPVVLSVVPPNTQDHNFTKAANNVTPLNNIQQPPSSVFLKVANSTINAGNPVQLSQMAHLNQTASNVRTQATCFAGPLQAHCNPQPKEKEQKEGVWITVFWPSYKKKKRLPTNLEPLGKALLRGTYEQIAAAAFKAPLVRRFLEEHFIREVGKQCDTLRSTKVKSLLRKYSDEDMIDFSFEKLCLEWCERAPLFYHVLMNCANTLHGSGALDWIPSVALAGSLLLRERNKDMCAMALLVSRIIRDSPNKEVAFDRLSKMQLTFVGNRGFSFRDDMNFFTRYDQEVEDFKQKKLELSKEKKGAVRTMVERRKESTGSAQVVSDEVNGMTADEGNVVLAMGNEGCEDEVNTGKSLDIPSQTEQPLDLFVADEGTEKNSPFEKEIESDRTVIHSSQSSGAVNRMGNQQSLRNDLDSTSQSSGKSSVDEVQHEIETATFEVTSHMNVIGQQLPGQNVGDTEMQDCEAEMSVDL